MQVYRCFANEMAEIMNEQWEFRDMTQGNVSKDKCSMIRYIVSQYSNASIIFMGYYINSVCI